MVRELGEIQGSVWALRGRTSVAGRVLRLEFLLGVGWVAGGCTVRCEAGEVVPGDLSEDVDDDLRCDFGVGVVELWWEFESELAGVLDDALAHAVAEAAERRAERLFVEVP